MSSPMSIAGVYESSRDLKVLGRVDRAGLARQLRYSQYAVWWLSVMRPHTLTVACRHAGVSPHRLKLEQFQFAWFPSWATQVIRGPCPNSWYAACSTCASVARCRTSPVQ
jgi:hypothetical protein